MFGGLLTRSILEPLAGGWDSTARFAVAASAVEVVAIGLFGYIIAATWRTSKKPFTISDAYILSALFWFVIQAVYEALYLAATFRAAPAELVPLVATWQGALRDLQIHGFATLMILGVSQRLVLNGYGFRSPSRRLALSALIGLNLAVVGEACGLILMRLDSRAWAALWYASVMLFAGCALSLVWSWKLHGGASGTDRSLKFIRAAYVWLFISLAMLVALPLYQFAVLPAINPDSAAVTMGFSHAYYGATRHAVTVGFISLMIVGVAARVVPALRGYHPKELPALWAPFVLINLGCALRVGGQTATDFSDWVFPLAGVSGVLEVTGLAFWGIHLVRVMLGAPGWEKASRGDGPGMVAPDDYVADVLDQQPNLLPVFMEFGFRPLAGPILRRTAARGVTIALACRIIGADLGRFLAALNAQLPAQRAIRSLPVLTPER
jgi:hypothetical protein